MQPLRKLQHGRRAKERMVAANPRLVVSGQEAPSGTWNSGSDSGRTIGLVRVEKFDPTRGPHLHLCLLVDPSVSRGPSPKRAARFASRLHRDAEQVQEGWAGATRAGRTPTVTELAQFVELLSDDVKDLMCRARQPVSLEMKVGDGDDTELLELLPVMAICPVIRWKRIVRRVICAASGTAAPSAGTSAEDALWHDGEDPMSLTGIGRILGMCRDRVRNLERDGLAGLRRVSDQVEAYVAC